MTKIGLNKRLMYAEQILTELLGVGEEDLNAIYDMEKHHPGTIDLAFELFEDKKPNFGFFVVAVKYKALEEVRDIVTSEDYESFEDMLIDDDYAFWGPIASYGSYEGKDVEANRERQELFAQYVRGLIDRETFAKNAEKLGANVKTKTFSKFAH